MTGDLEGQWAMTNRRALICACGLLLSVLAFRVFYIQELFFAFLFFALAYLLLLLVVAVVFCLLYLYARGMAYLAVRISEQGHHALPLLRVLVLWFAPTVTETAQVLSVGHGILFYPFYGLLHGWSQSLRRDVSQFREDTERALKHLRFLLKHN
jgi:hypothetical protein